MTRPRGFIDSWNPQKKTLSRMRAVQDVLTEYSDYLPLTIRQIFYRLVAGEFIGKTEAEYSKLCELLNKARRTHTIPMDAIRDDGFTGLTLLVGWRDKQSFFDTLRTEAEHYQKDRQAGQTKRLVIWCEARGMLPQLERVSREYGVVVKSSGGFDSLTTKHDFAAVADNTHILHIGDFDPSGECMYDALAEDVESFADYYGNHVSFSRLAVTSDHINKYSLPTAPPKPSSHQKNKNMTHTVQCEALDPVTLASIVRMEIETRMDMVQLNEVIAQESVERSELVNMLRLSRCH